MELQGAMRCVPVCRRRWSSLVVAPRGVLGTFVNVIGAICNGNEESCCEEEAGRQEKALKT
jgi:hypothetical protein